MFKKLSAILGIAFILTFSIGGSLIAPSAYAETSLGGEGSGSTGVGQIDQLVSSNGLITGFEKGKKICGGWQPEKMEKVKFEDIKASILSDPWESIKMAIFGVGQELINFLVSGLALLDSCGNNGANLPDDADESDEAASTLGIFNQPNIFTQYVNFTHIGPIMALVGMVQRMALVLMVFYVIYHAFNLLTGKPSAVESGSSMTFFIKFAVIMFVVYAAPHLMQDILNLNNKLSFMVANQSIGIPNQFTSIMVGETEIESLTNVPIGSAFVAAFGVFLQGILSDGDGLGNFVSFLVSMIVLLAILKPLLNLVLWWYTRLFKLFIYVVISPVMLMTLVSPATDATGKNFLTNFFRTAFEQLFVILGMGVVTIFMSVVPGLTQNLGLGFIGTGLAIYAGFTFVSQIPDMAGGMIEGRAEGQANLSGFRNAVGAQAVAKRYNQRKENKSNVKQERKQNNMQARNRKNYEKGIRSGRVSAEDADKYNKAKETTARVQKKENMNKAMGFKSEKK